jgi:hypothetical protein
VRRVLIPAAFVAVALAAACSSSPTNPDPSDEISAPTAVTIAADPQLSGTALTVRWDSNVAAARFMVHLGSAPGAADIGSFDAGTGRSYVHQNYQGRGRAYARVHASVGEGVSSLSAEASTDVYRLREAIEALFLANGRMSPVGNNGCGSPDRMRGFVTGTQVSVLAGATVPDERMGTISEFVGRVPGYTQGRLSGTVTRVASQEVPSAGAGQLSVSIGDPTSIGCTANVTGCFRAFVRAVGEGYFRAEIVVRPGSGANLYRHELGHAILGLCHIDQAALGGNTSVMTPNVVGDFTTVDLSAMTAVFPSSVQPGQERGSFIAAGLVDAVPALGARAPDTDLVIVGP